VELQKTMTKSETILETLKAHLPELREMGVKDLYVFGSVARGEPDPHDVDVLVDFEVTPSLFGMVGLQQTMEAWVGLHVDLVTRRACSPRLFRNISGDLRHVA
jgi:predicted nucleotidyltransferase